MSFYNVVETYDSFNINEYCSSITPEKVEAVINKRNLTELDFLALLSDSASSMLEMTAKKANSLTRLHFGNVIFIFTPFYISNFCDNVCAYCSFARQHEIGRKHLSFEEIAVEAEKIALTGIRHILVLTGESRGKASVEYIQTAVKIISERFSTVSIEIYPLTSREYGLLVNAGAEGLTIYQETYNKELYEKLHKGGPKADYRFRIEAPERACSQGMRSVTVGALFGLHDWRSEAFFTGIHAYYLQKSFPSMDVSVSFPRLRPLAGKFDSQRIVSDRQFVQMMTAMRLFLPSSGITVSTRESEKFRNSLLPLGVTKMSAGVSTAVGGHSEDPSTAQFEIADSRSVDKMKADLEMLGYQPVMHDWNRGYVDDATKIKVSAST